MICNRCGANNADTMNFCCTCGNRLVKPVGYAQYTPAQASPQQTSAVPPVQPAAPTQYAQSYAPQRPASQVAPQPVAQPAVQPVAPQTAPKAETKPVAQSASMPEAHTDAQTAAGTTYIIQKSNNGLVITLAVLLILVIVGFVGFFGYENGWFGEKDEDDDDNKETTSYVGEATTLPTTLPSINTTGSAQEYQEPTYDYNTTVVTNGNTGLAVPDKYNYTEICDAYNKAINDYRSYKGRVTLMVGEDISMSATDLPAALQGVINSVLEGFSGSTTNEYTFENGVDVNESYRTIDSKIIPWGRNAYVTPADIYGADVIANGDGGYTISFTVLSETSVYDGVNTTEPVHHMAVLDPLNFATLDLSPVSITAAEMYYPGAEITLIVDGQGRLIYLECDLPMSGSVTGGMGPVQATIGIEGSMYSTYEMIYG